MFERILIANRGEIAVRIIRACHALGIQAVAVYSEADRFALHVRRADTAHLIGPAPATQSYLRIEALIDAARASGAQAIHPGYGFLAERAELAQACIEAGLVFIGPSPQAIELMGSKVSARRLAAQSGVPTVPGYDGDDQADQRLHSEAERIGFPLMVKASAGGGGRGMRVVEQPGELAPALAAARREALAAFGDGRLFLERLILRPRHVEIQVLGDQFGNLLHLGERDCSIQRRHQKVVEESPSPALTPELRQSMGEAAVRLAYAAQYTNAGTCEFMLDQDSRFYFLEMNTRLQVEHPVTELVTGLDLVQWQIRVAAGQRLPFTQEDIHPQGHAIELRLTAEDPQRYLPSTGQITALQLPDAEWARVDAGVDRGDEISVHYDSLIAKLIVWGPTRHEALQRLQTALEQTAVEGLVTNLPLLRHIVSHPVFRAGEARTDFLSHFPLPQTMTPALPDEVLLAALGYELATRDVNTLAANQHQNDHPWMQGPWRVARLAMPFHYQTENGIERLLASAEQPGWLIEWGSRRLRLLALALRGDQELVLQLAEQAPLVATVRRIRSATGAEQLEVGWRGQLYRLQIPQPPQVDEYSPGHGHHLGHANLTAPMPGTITRVLVQIGDTVTRGQALLVLEAMKMEHTILAPYDGNVVQLPYRQGDLVGNGALLVELAEHDNHHAT